MKYRALTGTLGLALSYLSVICFVYAFASADVHRSVAGLLGLVLGIQGLGYLSAALVCFGLLSTRGRVWVSRWLSPWRGVAALCALGFIAALPLALASNTFSNRTAVALISFLLGVAPVTVAFLAERFGVLPAAFAGQAPDAAGQAPDGAEPQASE